QTRTADRSLALLYFEEGAVSPQVSGLAPGARYRWAWFDPRTGRWSESIVVSSAADGRLAAPSFPGGGRRAGRDWAAKLVRPRAARR
ncbi:MAG TPA: hypothetical protein VGB87_19790, partial [Vicinamibacteria bacterium]